MTRARDPPSLRKVQEADWSDFFRKDTNAGVSRGTPWDPEERSPWPYVGFRSLLCRNCGQFVSEKYVTSHERWHASQNFEDLYRRKARGRHLLDPIDPYKYGRKVA